MSGSKRPPRAKTLPRNFIRSQFSTIRKKVIQENSALYRSTDGGNDKTGTLNGQQKNCCRHLKAGYTACTMDTMGGC